MPHQPMHLRTPEPTLCTHSCLTHSPTSIYTDTGPCHAYHTRSQPTCMIITCPHTWQCIYLSMPCQASHLMHPWAYTMHTYVPPLHLYPCAYTDRIMSLMFTCSHDHHMPTRMHMSLPIDSLTYDTVYAYLSPSPHMHMPLSHTTHVPARAIPATLEESLHT